MKNITSVHAKDYGIDTLKELVINKRVTTLYTDNSNESDIYQGLIDKRSWLDDDRVWHVYPIAVEEIPHSNNANVFIICPLCGMVHRHGVGIENFKISINDNILCNNINDRHPRYEHIGHRVAHCGSYLWRADTSSINNGYIIEDITIATVMDNII